MSEIDKRQARCAFSRHTGGRDLCAEVGERLASRLDELDIAPHRIIDIGGNGELIGERFPQARVLSVDFALPRLSGARVGVLGDAEQLPVADGMLDMVWSNLCYEWTDMRASLSEAARVLRPEGVLIFSTLGRDTLLEARAAFSEDEHVHEFMDMHDIGDMLSGSGFAEPVLETEHVVLTYRTVADALREVHLSGAGNALRSRRRGLTSRVRWRDVEDKYTRHYGDTDGRIPVTFELIYVLCWRRPSSSEEQVVRFMR